MNKKPDKIPKTRNQSVSSTRQTPRPQSTPRIQTRSENKKISKNTKAEEIPVMLKRKRIRKEKSPSLMAPSSKKGTSSSKKVSSSARKVKSRTTKLTSRGRSKKKQKRDEELELEMSFEEEESSSNNSFSKSKMRTRKPVQKSEAKVKSVLPKKSEEPEIKKKKEKPQCKSKSLEQMKPSPKEKTIPRRISHKKYVTPIANPLPIITGSEMYSTESKLIVDCCTMCSNRNAIRAVVTENSKLLLECFNATDKLSGINYRWSSESDMNIFDYAVKSQNKEILAELINYFEKCKAQVRVKPPNYHLEYIGSGNVSYQTFGRAARKVSMTRGCRQGNNAFLNNKLIYDDEWKKDIVWAFIDSCSDPKLISYLNPITFDNSVLFYNFKKFNENFERLSTLEFNLYNSIHAGNLELAQFFMKKITCKDDYGFNELHETALTAKNGDFPIKYSPSVNKKSRFSITPVHFACINPNEDVLKTLLKSGGDVNFIDILSKKPIHYAALCSADGPLKVLLDNGANVNDRDKYKYTPLLCAARKGRLHNIKLLLKHGANLKYRVQDYAIHIAARQGHTHIVQYLINYKDVSPDILGKDKQSLLHIAAMKGNEALTDYLISQNAKLNAKDKIQRTPFLMAIKSGFLAIAIKLYNNGADPSICDNSSNSPIHYACAYGWIDALKFLLKIGTNINVENMWKITPFEIAVRMQHMGIVNYLTKDSKFDVNGRFSDGSNLLLQAFMNINPSSIEKIEYLLTLPNIDATRKDFNQNSCLHFLCRFTYDKFVQIYHQYQQSAFLPYVQENKLAEKNKGNGNSQYYYYYDIFSEERKIALQLYQNHLKKNKAKYEKEYEEILSKLFYSVLRQPDFVNNANNNKDTPLMCSLTYNNLTMFSLLLQNGANSNVTNHSGLSPIFLTIEKKEIDYIDLLLKYGANPDMTNSEGISILDYAMRKHSQAFDKIQLLIKFGANTNYISPEGDSLLFPAIISQSLDLTEILLKNGANVNYIHKEKQYNPLLLSFQYASDEIIQLLLLNGADVNYSNNGSSFPVQLALERNRISIAKNLIDRAADIYYCTKENETILHQLADKILDKNYNELWKSTLQIFSSHPSEALALVNLDDEMGFTPLLRIGYTIHKNIRQFYIDLLKEAFTEGLMAKYDSVDPEMRGTVSLSQCEKKEIQKNVEINFVKYLTCHVASVIQCLLSLGASPSEVTQIRNKMKIKKKRDELIKQELERFNKSTKKKKKLKVIPEEEITSSSFTDQYGYASILMFLMAIPLPELLSPFLESKAFSIDINVKDFLGKNCLLYLLQNDFLMKEFPALYTSTLKYLIEKKVNVNSCDSNGNSPFFICAKKWQVEEMHMLRNAGADINLYGNCGENALFWYVKQNEIAKVEYLFHHFNYSIDSVDKFSRTCLHYIMRRDDPNKDIDFSLLKYFLSKKAQPNLLDYLHRTPVFYLFIKQDEYDLTPIDPIATLMYLIESACIDLNVQDVFGNTILFYAIQRKANICISSLLTKGVDVNIVNREKNTPLVYNVLLTGNNASELISKGAFYDGNMYPMKIREISTEERKEQEDEEEEEKVEESDEEEEECCTKDENEDNDIYFEKEIAEDVLMKDSQQDENEEDNEEEEEDSDESSSRTSKKPTTGQNKTDNVLPSAPETIFDQSTPNDFADINKDEIFEMILEEPSTEVETAEQKQKRLEKEQLEKEKKQRESMQNSSLSRFHNELDSNLERLITKNSLGYKTVSMKYYETFGTITSESNSKFNEYVQISDKLRRCIKSELEDMKSLRKYEKHIDMETVEQEERQSRKKQKREKESKDKAFLKQRLKEKSIKAKEEEKLITTSLFKACAILGQQGLLYLLLNNGYDIVKGISEIFENKKLNLAALLLYKNTHDEIYQTLLPDSSNLLHCFARTCNGQSSAKDIEIFEIILSKGIDINSKDSFGYLPLHYACYELNFPLINNILSHSSLPPARLFMAKENKGETAFKKFFLNIKMILNKDEMYNIILTLTKDFYNDITPHDMKGNTSLHLICKFLCFKSIGHVISLMDNPVAMLNVKNIFNYTPLYYCFNSCNYDIVYLILNYLKPEDLLVLDSNGNLPIHFLCHKFYAKLIELMLGYEGENVTKMLSCLDHYGKRVFEYVMARGTKKMVSEIIGMMSKENIYERDQDGNTVMHILCKSFYVKAITKALSKVNSDIFLMQNNDGYYPFTMCFFQNSQIKKHIKKIYNITQAFISKILSDRQHMMTIPYNIFVESKTEDTVYLITPLIKVLKLFFEKIITNQTEIIQYKKKINTMIITDEIEQPKEYYYDYFLNTITLLITCGQSISEKDSLGESPIHMAIKENNSEIFSLLIDKSKEAKTDFKCDDMYENKSVIHLITQWLEIGSYENTVMLEKALSAGFKYDLRDHLGKKPIDYAYQQKTKKMFNILCKYDQVSSMMMKISASDVNMYVDDIMPYESDSEMLIKQKELKKDECIYVDPESKLNPQINIVVKDECEEKHYYDITLTKVKVGRSVYGEYLFYRMQVIHDIQTNVYILWNRWGRIGEEGGYQRTPFNNLDSAASEFQKIFKSKTGNEWSSVCQSKYERKKGKYVYIPQTRSKPLSNKELLEEFNFDEAPESTLVKKVKRLMKNISQSSLVNKTLQDNKIDTGMLAFSISSKNLLLEARGYLDKIDQTIKEMEVIKIAKENVRIDVTEIESQKSTTNTLNQRLLDLSQKIYDYSSRYYECLPKKGYGTTEIPPLNESSLNYEYQLIDKLIYMEKALKILLGAQYRLKEINPLDYCFKAINATIKEVNKKSFEYEYIHKYIQATGGSMKVINLYTVDRPEETLNGYELLPNHYLLFHGTKACNLLGILSQGLKISPIEARKTGNAFGNGIYFADMFSKSQGYCDSIDFCTKDKSLRAQFRYMFLCEVVLGNMREYTTSEYKMEGFHSLKVVSSRGPDFTKVITFTQGFSVPVGDVIRYPYTDEEQRSKYLRSDAEYIVYNPAQVKVRYLIEMIQ